MRYEKGNKQLAVLEVGLINVFRLKWQAFAIAETVQADAKEIVPRGQFGRQVELTPVDVESVGVPTAGRLQSGQRRPVELRREISLGVGQMNVRDPVMGGAVARFPK